MRIAIIASAVTLSMLGAGAAQAGCLGGAVVGGVAGHVAGRHGKLGMVGGCIVGHHMAVEKKRERMVANGRGYYDAHHRFHKN